MDLEFIGFIQAIVMQGNGLMDKVTELEFKLVLMLVVILANSSMVLNMDLVVTISGIKQLFY